MLSSRIICFRNFIFLLIFTVILCCTPIFEFLLSYKVLFSVAEAEAAETTEANQAGAAETTDAGQAEALEAEAASSEQSFEAAAASSEKGESSAEVTSALSFQVDEFTRTSRMNYPIVVPPEEGVSRPASH